MAGCAGDHSALDPAGPSAKAIEVLWRTMLVGSSVIFLATGAALILAWMRPDTFGRRKARILVVWGGLVLPSVILTFLVFWAFALGERLIVPSGSASLSVEAEGRQWQWQFRYPGTGDLTTADRMHIPAGTDVEVVVTSVDVVHSFWVPRLGGKIDAVPRHRNRIVLRADKPGTYGGLCAEYCGIGHAPMRFTVVAHPADTYDEVLSRIADGERP